MNDLLIDAKRRLFLWLCASAAAGLAVPAIFSFRTGAGNDDYAVINGWVVPFSHLKVDVDA